MSQVKVGLQPAQVGGFGSRTRQRRGVGLSSIILPLCNGRRSATEEPDWNLLSPFTPETFDHFLFKTSSIRHSGFIQCGAAVFLSLLAAASQQFVSLLFVLSLVCLTGSGFETCCSNNQLLRHRHHLQQQRHVLQKYMWIQVEILISKEF